MVASHQRASGGVLPHGGKRMAKAKSLQPGAPFIGERERDSAEVGPHVGDDDPCSGRSRESSVDLGHYSSGPSPNH
jgi:hypothetical protein